ncbi:unnamed protein product [Chrysoparadoxa australica]
MSLSSLDDPVTRRWGVAFIVATLMATRGLKKKSLSASGAVAAWCVGFLTLGCSTRMGLVLIVFYQMGSWVTKIQQGKKAVLTEDHKEGGQRSAAQVLSCSLPGVVIALLRWGWMGLEDSLVDFESDPTGSSLTCAYLGFFACCAGDTFSSEIGELSQSPPMLITTLSQVPRGTNGGVSFLGSAAALVGGVLMGATMILVGRSLPPPLATEGEAPSQTPLLVLGAISGFLGSMLDSLMGAVVQVTYYSQERKCVVSSESASKAALASGQVVRISGRDWLSNTQVNAWSATIIAIASGYLGGSLWTGMGSEVG